MGVCGVCSVVRSVIERSDNGLVIVRKKVRGIFTGIGEGTTVGIQLGDAGRKMIDMALWF